MIIFQVTQKHINTGKRNNTHNCPINLSLKNKGIKPVYVMQQCIEIEHKNPTKRYYQNLASLTDWMKKFDTRKEVKPIEIIMEKGIARILNTQENK